MKKQMIAMMIVVGFMSSAMTADYCKENTKLKKTIEEGQTIRTEHKFLQLTRSLKDYERIYAGTKRLADLKKKQRDWILGTGEQFTMEVTPGNIVGFMTILQLSLVNLHLTTLTLKDIAKFFDVKEDDVCKIEILNLSSNRLTHISEDIGDIESLTSLDLSRNKLTSLPSGIENNLKYFSSLNLSHNQLGGRGKDITPLIKSLESLITNLESSPMGCV